jgi:hypothetical protein
MGISKVIIPRQWNWEGDIVLALSVRPSVCPGYLRGVGGHLTVNRTKENNRVHSVTIE